MKMPILTLLPQTTAATGWAISGASGSGALTNVYCRAKTTGLTMNNIVAGQTAYRDTLNNTIPMTVVIPGKVVVK
jgi:hypothetical protein